MMDDQDQDTCLRCGRHLKSPKARQAGYGRICLKKELAEKEDAEKAEKREEPQE